MSKTDWGYSILVPFGSKEGAEYYTTFITDRTGLACWIVRNDYDKGFEKAWKVPAPDLDDDGLPF